MKMNKKKIFVMAVAVCLIAILSFSTLAWFSDADEVTNKFMVAHSGDKPDDIFSVDIKERVDTNGDGKYDATLDVGKVENGGFTYENILPGDSLYKEPIVKNTGSYDQYVRVKVTATDAREWKTMLANHKITDLTDIFKGYDENLWIRVDEPEMDEDQDTITYVFYLEKILKPGEEESLFTNVVIPYQLTQNDLVAVGGSFELKIVAEAVQTENVGANALEAFKTVEASGQEIDQIK